MALKIKMNESNSGDDDNIIYFLSGMFTQRGAEALKEKGFNHPTDVEKALWVAYGIFNLSECLYKRGAFIDAITDFIESHGGWEYFG